MAPITSLSLMLRLFTYTYIRSPLVLENSGGARYALKANLSFSRCASIRHRATSLPNSAVSLFSSLSEEGRFRIVLSVKLSSNFIWIPLNGKAIFETVSVIMAVSVFMALRNFFLAGVL